MDEIFLDFGDGGHTYRRVKSPGEVGEDCCPTCNRVMPDSFIMVNGPLRVDLNVKAAYLDGKKFHTTRKGLQLLTYLMRNRGRVIPKRTILRDVWGPAHVDADQYLRVYIGRLRECIEPDRKNPTILVTVGSEGYMLNNL